MHQNMQYIYTIWQEGSFSRAAQRLYLSQPALSIAVRKVEAELGMPLFDRSTQPLSLTPAGELYIQAAQRIRTEENALRERLNDLGELRTGSLRVGGATLFTTYLLPPLVALFMERYPGVQIELNEYSAGEYQRHLVDGELDLILHVMPMPPAVFSQQLLTREHLLLAVPQSLSVNDGLEPFVLSRQDVLNGRHLRSDCPRVDVGVFCDESFLALGPGNDLFGRATQICTEAGFSPRIRLVLNQQVTAYRMAARGLGLNFATDTLVRGDASPGLCYYVPNSSAIRREILLTAMQGRYLNRTGQEFRRMALEYFAPTR